MFAGHLCKTLPVGSTEGPIEEDLQALLSDTTHFVYKRVTGSGWLNRIGSRWLSSGAPTDRLHLTEV